MRLLVVGGGGREHALCWALRRENPDAAIFCAPGNPGTALVATNLPVAATDLHQIVLATEQHKIDLTIAGPEAPLAAGLADRLREAGQFVVGPDAGAAKLEASKAFAKEVMQAAGVPTAASGTFESESEALAFVDRQAEPLVVKASGLAGGKGAIVCARRAEARAAVKEMMGGRFGEAGQTVVIEEFLEGEELSLMALTDGESVTFLPASQDHKRLLEGDQGPNTGGMGAYAPVALATPALLERARREIMEPTLAELSRRGAPFRGILYAGLMIGPDGSPSVVEFNCRLGDPETEVVLPLITGGLTAAFQAVARGEKPAAPSVASDRFAVTTVLASRGYPDKPERGAAITIPDQLPDGVVVFHAGTARDADGVLRVAGGRVLNVTAVAGSFAEAQARSREGAEAVQFEGKVFRGDIGWREAGRAR